MRLMFAARWSYESAAKSQMLSVLAGILWSITGLAGVVVIIYFNVHFDESAQQ